MRGGLRLEFGEAGPIGASAWIAQRWLRLLEQAAEGPSLILGRDYASEGQTKRMSVGGGRVEAQVQGRAFRPYTTTLSVETIPPEQWDRVVKGLSEGSVYAAKLLSGEMPTNIEDVFSPHGLRLSPAEPSDVRVECSCGHDQAPSSAGGQGWCKHACCVVMLLAERMAGEPFLLFSLRGLDPHDLVDRLRQRRQVDGAALGATPIYRQRVAGVAEARSDALEQRLADFWDLGAIARQLELPVAPPPLSHPLLRRLGQSPWTGPGATPAAQFPLVGLLASCYETISNDALKAAAHEGEEPDDAEAADDDPDRDPDHHNDRGAAHDLRD